MSDSAGRQVCGRRCVATHHGCCLCRYDPRMSRVSNIGVEGLICDQNRGERESHMLQHAVVSDTGSPKPPHRG